MKNSNYQYKPTIVTNCVLKNDQYVDPTSANSLQKYFKRYMNNREKEINTTSNKPIRHLGLITLYPKKRSRKLKKKR
jgi:hypothetical protein